MRLNELFEARKQDDLRTKIQRLKAKSKRGNPTHEYEEVKGKPKPPAQPIAVTGHVGKDQGTPG